MSRHLRLPAAGKRRSAARVLRPRIVAPLPRNRAAFRRWKWQREFGGVLALANGDTAGKDSGCSPPILKLDAIADEARPLAVTKCAVWSSLPTSPDRYLCS